MKSSLFPVAAETGAADEDASPTKVTFEEQASSPPREAADNNVGIRGKMTFAAEPVIAKRPAPATKTTSKSPVSQRRGTGFARPAELPDDEDGGADEHVKFDAEPAHEEGHKPIQRRGTAFARPADLPDDDEDEDGDDEHVKFAAEPAHEDHKPIQRRGTAFARPADLPPDDDDDDGGDGGEDEIAYTTNPAAGAVKDENEHVYIRRQTGFAPPPNFDMTVEDDEPPEGSPRTRRQTGYAPPPDFDMSVDDDGPPPSVSFSPGSQAPGRKSVDAVRKAAATGRKPVVGRRQTKHVVDFDASVGVRFAPDSQNERFSPPTPLPRTAKTPGLSYSHKAPGQRQQPGVSKYAGGPPGQPQFPADHEHDPDDDLPQRFCILRLGQYLGCFCQVTCCGGSHHVHERWI
jgi:hypothetical protein